MLFEHSRHFYHKRDCKSQQREDRLVSHCVDPNAASRETLGMTPELLHLFLFLLSVRVLKAHRELQCAFKWKNI